MPFMTKVQLANPTGFRLPGMYAFVRSAPERPEPPLLVPDEALVIRADGAYVAVLELLNGNSQGIRRVHFQKVQPGRDYGIELEVLSGLRGDEEVIVDPSDAAKEGVIVQPTPAASGQAN